MNETTDIGISLASLSNLLCNVYVSIDSFVEVFVLSTRTNEVDDNVGVLDSFIVKTIVIEVEVAHNVALSTASAELQFLYEIIVSVDVIMREDDITSDVAERSTDVRT